MNNLLRGDFYRTLKSNYFFICLMIDILASVYLSMQTIELFKVYFSDRTYDFLNFMEVFLLGCPFFIVLIVSVVLVVSVGMDYDGGMIRNKIVAGYSKTQIFISKAIVNFAVTIIFVAVNLLISVGVHLGACGTKLFVDAFSNQQLMKAFLICSLEYLLFALFLAVFVTAITINVEKTIAAFVIVMVLIIGSNIGGENLNYRATSKDKVLLLYYEELDQYKIEENTWYVPDGTPEKTALVALDSANVLYRSVNFINCYDHADIEEVDYELIYVRYVVGDIVMTIVVGVLGIEIFKRRNTK